MFGEDFWNEYRCIFYFSFIKGNFAFNTIIERPTLSEKLQCQMKVFTVSKMNDSI